MARIRTYDAPIDRIRPDDRGFTAQENAARRIQFATQDQVSALREGGRLAAQNIRAQYSADRAIDSLLNPPAPRSSGGGGGGSAGGGGGGSRGGGAAPREAAQGAAALGRALGGPSNVAPDATTPALPQWHSYEWPGEPRRQRTTDPVTFGSAPGETTLEGLGYDDPLGQPSRAAGGNMQRYGYGTATSDTGDFSSRPEAPSTASALWGWAQSFAGSIASGFGAGAEADAEASRFFQGPE